MGGLGYIFSGGIRKKGSTAHSGEGDTEWIPIQDLGQYPLVEDLTVLLPKIVNWQPGVPPFSARYYYDEAQQLQIVFAPESVSGEINS